MGEKYEQAAARVISGLKEFKGFYSQDYFLEFEERISSMKSRIEDSMKEGRLLKIGIVGEVKAGKSSFLNALLFEGKDILPKASTPMTAALTKITYSEKQKATIVFYSIKDWERVEQFAFEYQKQFEDFYNQYRIQYEKRQMQAYGDGSYTMPYEPLKSREQMRKIIEKKIPNKLVSCNELTSMANNASIDIHTYLGTKPLEIDVSDMKSGLQDYIGVNGKFTSIVKHVELQMNNEMLQGVEIVDTPGLNDPIISRGETTKQFLRNCDVVFLLSYCGQFLSQEDISFMSQTLPSEGIKNIVIIGSKFDSGILDDNKSKDYITAVNNSAYIYRQQAESNIRKCLGNGYNSEIIRRIYESLPPSFVSSMLYSCAIKREKGETYSDAEAKIIEELKRFNGFTDDVKTLKKLSGIPEIRVKRIKPIMSRKQEIIEEKNKDIISDNKRILLGLLEDINIQVLENKESISSLDKDQLEKKLKTLQGKLNTMRREIKNIFNNCAVDADKFLNYMKVSIDKEIENYIDFDVTTTTRPEHGSYRSGFLGLFRTSYTYEVTSHHAQLSDVTANLRGYIVRCKQLSNEEFEKIINLRKLRDMVKETVIGAFDLTGRDFNENDILIPLDIVVKKIKIPQINIDVEEFEPMIIDAFSGATVDNEDIHELRLLESQVLNKISKKVKSEIDNCQKNVDEVMADQAATFVDNIINLLTSNIENLRQQIDDKENAIRRYDVLSKKIVEYKGLIQNMEL